MWDEELEKLVPKDEYRRKQPKRERGDFPAPMVSTGQIDIQSPVDGKHYSTLRNYEKSIPKGNHIVEKGEWGEPKAKEYAPDYKEITESIATSWEQAEAGYKSDDHFKSEKEFGTIE